MIQNNPSESIYHYVGKIEKEKQNIINNKKLSERNKELIFKYCRERKVKKNFRYEEYENDIASSLEKGGKK